MGGDRLAGVRLDVADVERSIAFYRDLLGMTLRSSEGTGVRLGYDDLSADVVLRASPPARPPARDDVYWKIGITLRDVDHAAGVLRHRGVDVSRPAQFLDVGYLCHLADPDGHEIELLQHRHEANHQPSAPESECVLGSRPVLGQITLRVPEADPAVAYYSDGLGMRILSRQDVEPHRFSLYFLAFTDEQPPVGRVDSPENSEWLWQRPYTTLELQHRWDGPTPKACADAGFGGIEIETKRDVRPETIVAGEVPIHRRRARA